MDAARESGVLVLAIITMAFGTYGFLRGSLEFGGVDSGSDRLLTGYRARAVSVFLFGAGTALLLNHVLWFSLLFVASFVLAWLFSR